MSLRQVSEIPTERSAGRRRRTNSRWLIIVIAAIGTAVAYVDRANLSVALPFIQRDLDLNPAIEGVILSSFFWTYSVAQLPAGWLLDRFGPRVMFGLAAIWWGVFTAATTLARGFGSLLGLRMLLGVGEAPMMPANSKVVSVWFPRQERAFASGIFNSGTEGGSALALPICAGLIAFGGWRFSFIATGALGVLWAIGWIAMYRSPRRHRLANDLEVAHIEGGDAHVPEAEEEQPAVRWIELLRYRTVWGMILGYICRASCVYFFATWFPTFLRETQHLNLAQLGAFGVIPGLASIVAAYLGGWLCDVMVRRGVRLARARKIMLVTGMLGAGVIAFAGFSSNLGVAITFLAVSYAFSGSSGGAVWSLPADIAPHARNVASLASLQNFGSQIGGIFSPIVIGVLVTITGGFTVPLLFIGALTVVGALIYGLMVKIEPLPIRSATMTSMKMSTE